MTAGLLLAVFAAALVLSLAVLVDSARRFMPAARLIRAELRAVSPTRAVTYRITEPTPRALGATIYRLCFKARSNSLPFQPAARAAA
ncbi:MAG: hypothetical protein JF593_04160 [Novosphingobium sp.]|nr:hypothetical protein [Novosphingobium sp.]